MQRSHRLPKLGVKKLQVVESQTILLASYPRIEQTVERNVNLGDEFTALELP